MKEILRVEELEENKVELKEVAEDWFPIIFSASVLSIVLLCIFLLRLYMRWCVPCPSKNRMDGKTVIITGGFSSGSGSGSGSKLGSCNHFSR